MKRRFFWGGVGIVLLALCGIWYVCSAAFLERVTTNLEEEAAGLLGVPVSIGSIARDGVSSLTVHDVILRDKRGETLLSAEKVKVDVSLFAAFEEEFRPARAVRKVRIIGADATLVERDDAWNFEDIATKGGGENDFRGKVIVENSKGRIRTAAGELSLAEIAGEIDFADYPTLSLDGTAEQDGVKLSFEGTVSSARQILEARVRDVDVMRYKNFLPAFPDGIDPEALTVSAAEVHILREGGDLRFSGKADYTDGRMKVLGTDVAPIEGFLSFTEKQLVLDAKLRAAGEPLKLVGTVAYDGAEPYLNLDVTSDRFDFVALFADLAGVPYRGRAKFSAHAEGVGSAPEITAQLFLPEGSAAGIPFQNLEARAEYAGKMVNVQEFSAETFGGNVKGEVRIAPKDLKFAGHLKAEGLAVSAFPLDFAGAGTLGGDFGFTGMGDDKDSLAIFGEARVTDAQYKGLSIARMSSSFFYKADELKLDMLTMKLPSGGDFGIEGTVKRGEMLDLKFYGSHLELAHITALLPTVPLEGISDMKGTVRGSFADPQVALQLSAANGRIFYQPFDSLLLEASGSLAEVGIDTFLLEKNGKNTWLVQGSIGLAGERRIHLQIDTVGARMEDVARLVAPTQPITGNIDNIIKITGTLDNPAAVGYVHFYQGSYQGVLLSGMDGDYFLENGLLRLQDFHLYSPMVDLDVNGTIDRAENLDMAVDVHDINMKRFAHKFPYPVEGHGVFQGHIGGTISAPSFDGTLDAPHIMMNGENFTAIKGRVLYQGDKLSFRNFGFAQGAGRCDMAADVDLAGRGIQGNLSIDKLDVKALAALLNQKTELFEGTLLGSARLWGTLDRPLGVVKGELEQGAIAGYDVHDVHLKVRAEENGIFIDEMRGSQGGAGSFEGTGRMTSSGEMDFKLHAQTIKLGLPAKLAGAEMHVIGDGDFDAIVQGTMQDPVVLLSFEAYDGGVEGSTFDKLTGRGRLSDGLLHVDTLRIEKALAEKTYEASATGVLPLRALKAGAEDIPEEEQIQMKVVLDQANLAILPTLSPLIASAEGSTAGTVRVSGTIKRPKLHGDLTVLGGRMKFKALELPVEDMNMRLHMDGANVALTEFTGKMGAGTYAGTGAFRLDGQRIADYDFDLKLHQLEVVSSFFKGPITGTFHLQEEKLRQMERPKLSGNLDFANCTVALPALPDSEGEIPDIGLDFRVNLGEKVHLYSPHLFDMYMKGAVHFGGTARHPLNAGSMAVQRGGTLSYLKTVFKIREGEIYFNQLGSFLPSINFQADTRLVKNKIMLSAVGPLGNTSMKLTSSPEMSETEIIRLLTLHDAYYSGQGQPSSVDLLSVGIQMALLAELENSVKNGLQLDEFTIARGSGSVLNPKTREDGVMKTHDGEVYNVSLGKNLSDKVLFKYTHGIGESTRRFGIAYDMNERYGLSLDYEDGAFIFGTQVRIRF